jgi:hypothetical protein
LIATRNVKSNKKRDDLSGRKSRGGSHDGEGGENSSRKGGDGKDNDLVTDEKVIHKKKLKKNVESKDAWTQTERSDYMLIKQR